VKPLTSVALFVALAGVFSLSQTTSPGLDGTDPDTAKLMSIVKQTPASQLGSALPKVAFEQWLAQQVGKHSAIAWVLRTGQGHDLPWVEADISIERRPALVIMIACGGTDTGADTKPRFQSLQLVRKNEFAEWPHLHDLRAAMKRAQKGQA
jgi:hypothetical protein